MPTVVPRSVRIATAALALALCAIGSASAQDVTEPSLKAAYIYNFAKFTDWPPNAISAAQPLAMCVWGDDAVGDALRRLVKERTIAGHTMAVSIVGATAIKTGCHILYLSGVSAADVGKLVAGVRDTAILTISDLDRFTELGGIAQFYFEHGQLRFDVGLAALKRTGLQMSSQLLTLARPK